jgi:hypothetical protein
VYIDPPRFTPRMTKGRPWDDYSPDEDLPPLIFADQITHPRQCLCAVCKVKAVSVFSLKTKRSNIVTWLDFLPKDI